MVRVAWRRLAEVTILAFIYYTTARLGLLLQLPGTNASPVWPPSGLGLAAVLLFGLRVWPGIALGAFLANLATLPHTSAGLVASVVIAAGSTLEHVLTRVLIGRLVPSLNPFERAPDVFWFIVAAGLGCAVASTSGVAVLWLTGIIPAQIVVSAWFTWGLGDTVGMVILAPALVLWGRAPRLGRTAARLGEFAALAAATLLMAELLFGSWFNNSVIASLPYAVIVPGLFLVSFRFGPRETATLAALVSAVAIGHTCQSMRQDPGRENAVAHIVPFVNPSFTVNDSLLGLQGFLGALGITSLALAAAVAERRHSEERLSDSERRFRTIFEQAAVGVALIETATGRFIRLNARYCAMLGMTERDYVATTWMALTHSTDLQADLDNMAALVDGRIRDFTMEKRLVRKDGSQVWVNLTVSATWQPGETPAYHIAVVEDISERKQAGEALRKFSESLEQQVADRTADLRKSEDRLRLTLDNARHGLWDWDIATGREYLDDRWYAIHGYAPGEIPATHEFWEQSIHPEDLPRVAAMMGQHRAGSDDLYDAEYRARAKNGEWIWINSRGRVNQRDAEGKPLRMTGTIQDITGRKRAEEQVKASLREKEVLLKEIHHRVKNNLQIVSTLLDLQSGHTADPRALAMFQESRGRVKSMALIHERLYRSQDMARVNFTEYVRQLADDLCRTYKISGDDVRLELDVDIPPLPIDLAIPCGLLLNELMSNCFKHAFAGAAGGTIRLSLRRDGETNVLILADDGAGFPAGADFRNTESFGLQLVNTLVDQLDGDIEMAAGRGTTFTVRFPKAKG